MVNRVISFSATQSGQVDFEASVAARIKSLDVFVDDSVRAGILSLPQSDQVWMVDIQTKTNEGEDSSGYKTEYYCSIGLVERETGSNGKPWNVTTARIRPSVRVISSTVCYFLSE